MASFSGRLREKPNDDGAYIETAEELMELYGILQNTLCQFKGCTDLANAISIAYRSYNPKYQEQQICLCRTHKKYARKMFTDYTYSINALWEFKGKNPFTEWCVDHLTWYSNTFLRAIAVMLQHIMLNMQNIMDIFNELAVPEELYYDEAVLKANITLCLHVVQKRGTECDKNFAQSTEEMTE